MKILVVCDQGNNRSVTFAHALKYKYKGSDVLTAGVKNTSEETLFMLFDWADVIIATSEDQAQKHISLKSLDKVKVWDVGEDNYPRPFNSDLKLIVDRVIEENPLV